MPTFDFDDLPPDSTITTHYAPLGLLFKHGAFIGSDPQARSGSNVLRAGDPTFEFHQGPLAMDFLAPLSEIRFYAGGYGLATQGTLRVFDVDGNLLQTDGPKPVAPNVYSTLFEVVRQAGDIRRAEFQQDSASAFESIDDLEIIGSNPPSLPVGPPTLTISAPSDSSELDQTELTISGVVEGEGLLGTATARVSYGLPLGSTAAPIDIALLLSGQGETRPFSTNLLAPLGPIEIEVSAENLGGYTAKASASVTNLPIAISQHYQDNSGPQRFGQLNYAIVDGGVVAAVFDSGMLSWDGSHVFESDSAIFIKWQSLLSPYGVEGHLGPAVAAEEMVESYASKQRFRRGAIYSRQNDAFVVPLVFEDAIQELGGASGVGIPINDPFHSVGVNQTWLFQQFDRPDHPDLIPSTLEIRGHPAQLIVQRHAGDLSLFSEIGVGFPRPTLTQRFECDGPDGPCRIVKDEPDPGDRVQDAGQRFCGGKAWDDSIPHAVYPPFWVPVRSHDTMTEAIGIVHERYHAEWDNPAVHEQYGPAPKYPSDFNLNVKLLPEYEFLLTPDRQKLHIEWERYWSRYFEYYASNELRLPFVGDLIYLAGRWVVDCGHNSFKSELHPPGVLVSMFTARRDDQAPATVAIAWVNGYYSGQPLTFDISPPPRPSPHAQLVLEKPVDADAIAGDLNVTYNWQPLLASSHIAVTLSAPFRSNAVEDTGMMLMRHDRWYQGRWELWWEA